MPTYKKKVTSLRSTLIWGGYKFPHNQLVITEGFVPDHPELELISAEPLPKGALLLQQYIKFETVAGGEVSIEVPQCKQYSIQLRCLKGTLLLTEVDVESAALITIPENMAYVNGAPVAWASVQKWHIESENIAEGILLMERLA